MYSISDTTELALRKSCRYRRRLVAWAWLSTRRRGWVDVLAPIALFPAQPPPACCSSGFLSRREPRGGHDFGISKTAHHVVESQAPLPCAIVGMNGRHGGSLPDLVRGRVRVRIHAAPQCVRAAAVELVLLLCCTLYEYRLICSNCAA